MRRDLGSGSGSGYPDYDLDTGICQNDSIWDFPQGYESSPSSLAIVLGTVGNLLVVLLSSVLCNRLKTVTDVYLLNLAVADLLFLATLSFGAVNAAWGWAFGPHGAGLCKAVVAVYKLNCICGMLLLTCISVDRYVAIVRATRAHNLSRERRMLYSWVACLAAWLLSALLALPDLLLTEVRESLDGLTSCELLSGTQTRTKARSFHKHKALCVILAVVVVFVLSQLPYHIHLMLQASITDCAVVICADVVGQVVKSMAYMHTYFNPFLYMFGGERSAGTCCAC
ncbi:hypothetical protein CRUP_031656 [Coryphaenoides rupestris]|nr:hypothetical protein CRUP_031656 [Coryphaenoides rupestris]